MNFIEPIKRLTNKLDLSFRRFPITMIFATLAVMISIFINHSSFALRETQEIYSRVVMTMALGVPLSLSISMFFEGRSKLNNKHLMIAHIGGGLLLIFYHFYILKNMEMVGVTRYVAYTISLYLAFTFIPYLDRKNNYECYVVKLLTRFIVTYLYSAILYLGLAAIIATINLLFNAGIPGKLFFDIFLIVVGIFAPGFFLADVPKSHEIVSVESYPKVLNVLFQFIILPLLAVYTLILYVYFGRILITREIPQGVIGNLVLWYGIISTLVLFLIYPLRKNNQWIKGFTAVLPKAIIPLLGMMFVALWMRINAYGFTESRYFVLVIGLWVSCMMIYHAIKREAKNLVLSVSLAIVALVAVTGPWSAYSISQSSQNNRLEKILNRYDMIDETSNIQEADGEILEEDKQEISAIIRYFNRYHSLGDVRYLPRDFEISHMNELFGFELYDQWMGYPDRNYFAYYLDEVGNLIDISEYDYLIEFATYGRQHAHELREGYEIFYSNEEKVLEIQYQDETIYMKNIEVLAMDVHRQNRGTRNATIEEMTFVDENEAIKIQLVFKQINGFENRDENQSNVEGLMFYTFITIK